MKREVRAELSPENEKLAQKQAEKLAVQEVRETQEQLRERDQQIKSLKRMVTTLQKKLPDGRAQELGVVRQWTLAEALESRFRVDNISVTAHGVAGADVVQVVRDPNGKIVVRSSRSPSGLPTGRKGGCASCARSEERST